MWDQKFKHSKHTKTGIKSKKVKNMPGWEGPFTFKEKDKERKT